MGILELLLSLWESVLGPLESILRPLDVVFFVSVGRFLVSGLILSLWGRFWDSLEIDVGHLGADFGTLGVIFSPESQMYAIKF